MKLSLMQRAILTIILMNFALGIVFTTLISYPSTPNSIIDEILTVACLSVLLLGFKINFDYFVYGPVMGFCRNSRSIKPSNNTEQTRSGDNQ